MIVLGIETSCDETAAAVVRDETEVMASVISSQVDLHAEYGGVVPELASRRHLERIIPVIDQAVATAEIGLEDIDGIAVTCGPGLMGALLVGLSAAKGLSIALGTRYVGVNHLQGHIHAAFIEHGVPEQWPVVALVVSGGHSDVVVMKGYGEFEVIGRTRDDAAGEAFDKTARALGLAFPGGPEIDRLAGDGDSSAVAFPRAMLEPDSFDFSFSGLKTAVLVHLDRAKRRGEQVIVADVAASFQQAVIDVLVAKTVSAAQFVGAKKVLLVGGVAANRGLRSELLKRSQAAGLDFKVPRFDLCTDNAAMIACAGFRPLADGECSAMELTADPGMEL